MGFFVAFKLSQDAPQNASQNWNEFLYAIPAVSLFIFFIIAFVLTLRKSKYSLYILLLSLILAIASFTYDASNRNYQMHMESMTGNNQGGTFKYFTWWWYSHY
jgi:hypothetical protein